MNKSIFTLLCTLSIASVFFTSCETTKSQSNEQIDIEQTVTQPEESNQDNTLQDKKHKKAEKAKSKVEEVEEVKEPEPLIEEPAIPHFDDWEYKGFGSDLPEWIEIALNNNVSELKKLLHFSEEAEILVFIGKGINADHAKQKLQEKINQSEDNNTKKMEIVQKIWVRINSDYEQTEEPYIAIEVLK